MQMLYVIVVNTSLSEPICIFGYRTINGHTGRLAILKWSYSSSVTVVWGNDMEPYSIPWCFYLDFLEAGHKLKHQKGKTYMWHPLRKRWCVVTCFSGLEEYRKFILRYVIRPTDE
jgi:hypothetical protein